MAHDLENGWPMTWRNVWLVVCGLLGGGGGRRKHTAAPGIIQLREG